VTDPGRAFGRAEDTMTLVGTLDRPGVRLMLDLYHAQIGRQPHRAGAQRGTAHRRDPGRGRARAHGARHGEVNWPAVAAALEGIGYAGVVGLESFASGDDVLALERFRAAFSRA
jgi:hydroxypyruvate isomerase